MRTLFLAAHATVGMFKEEMLLTTVNMFTCNLLISKVLDFGGYKASDFTQPQVMSDCNIKPMAIDATPSNTSTEQNLNLVKIY